MNKDKFYDWRSLHSEAKLKALGDKRPYLNAMRQIRFEKGSMKMKYKLNYNQEAAFEELNFLQVKALKNGIPKPMCLSKNAGIQKQKKNRYYRKINTPNAKE